VTGGWRKPLHNLRSVLNIIINSKSRKTRWSGLVTRMVEKYIQVLRRET
jgi:hypothetical protein